MSRTGESSDVNILDSDDATINPATKDKQDDLIAALGGFQIPPNDYVARAWTAGTFTEVWTFYTGGSGGTLVATVTIIYDDEDMDNIINITKT